MTYTNMTEHLTCTNYDNGKSPLIEMKNLSEGETLCKDILSSKIILIISGKINYSYGIYTKIEVKAGSLFLLPSSYNVELEALEDTLLIVFRLNTMRQLCERFQLEKLMDVDYPIDFDTPYKMVFNKPMEHYVEGMTSYLSDGLHCYTFHELKSKELFYIFRIYYSKQEVKQLFYPLLTNDLSFSEKVTHASLKARSVQDLADATGYSASGFSKRFRKVFNEPAYQWLQQKRADRLHKQLSKTDIPLKELIEIEGFSSQTELNKFCTRYYGMTAYKLRKK